MLLASAARFSDTFMRLRAYYQETIMDELYRRVGERGVSYFENLKNSKEIADDLAAAEPKVRLPLIGERVGLRTRSSSDPPVVAKYD